MDRAQHVLEDRAERLSTTKVFFEVRMDTQACLEAQILTIALHLRTVLQDLSATLKRYEYQPTPEDSQAIQDCVSGIAASD